MLCLHAMTGEGNFRQTSFSSLPPAKMFLNSKFHLIIHILFNNSFSSHLVGVTTCSQATENILHYTQLGRMLTLDFFFFL